MKELRSYDSVSSVLATFRAGTPLKAAKASSRAPSTVYRAIERLEKDIGGALFERTPAGWLPTDLGLRVIRLAETIEAETTEAELFLLSRNRQTPRSLRISASDGFSERYLGSVLTEFMRNALDLTIELITDNQLVDLARREADIVVRPDQKPGEGLVGQRVGRLAHALYCATSLIERQGAPASASDLSRFNICMLSPSLQHFTGVRWWSQRARQQRKVSFVANTETALAAAIAAGAGVGVLPCFLGDQLSGVQRVNSIPVGPPVDIWLVSHASLRDNPIVKSVIRTLAAAMRRDAAQLSGLQNGR